MKNLAPFFLAAPIIVIIFFFLIFSDNPYLVISSDFVSYFAGAKIVGEGKGELIYNLATQSEYFEKVIHPFTGQVLNRYIAPPFVALIYLPFTLLNFFTAYKLFTLFNLGLFLVLIYLLSGTFKNAEKLSKLIFFIPLYFYSSITALVNAQTSFLLALLVLTIYKLLKVKKPFLVGICTALLLIKPQYFLFFPFVYLLINNKKKYILGTIFGLFSFFLISLFITGTQGLIDYPAFVLATENPEFGNRAFQMFSLHGLISSLFFSSDLSNTFALIFNFLGYFVAFSLFAKSYKKLSFNSSFIIMIFLSLLFSVHALSHDLILLLIPIFILLDAAYRNKKGRRNLFSAAFALFIIPATIFLGTALPGTVMLIMLTLIFLLRPKFLGKL